ncbi:putative 2-aminoethylphosphonate ABC transporter permease subunit [Chitinimonas koreensis]|uniref:putative 2-aminoethylphosphonate ABC transporter permease subunit n=1 Tax=Chitinimonas koreensis TaxID=356302 RepID=UPI0016548476|nr:putative 2-aminoethylphosphonate ABC transporter permease subunit [Chitinimonas koreensis]QNM98603.1 putative 2-aminoethylphosphonate ABC transporter permease subunit [Chitinimonas koreensis]
MSTLALHRPAALAADQRPARALAWLAAALLLVFVAWPLASILLKAVDGPGGLGQAAALLAEPRLVDATLNSLGLALATTALVLPPALLYAFALTRSRVRARPLLRTLALAPLLAPSLLPAISLVYLFGNQGLLRSWLGGASIYGPLGIVLGEAFYTFPHALLILLTALGVADARLYEAAETLGAGKLRRFLTVTLPHIRYGLASAAMVVFTLAVTDFGVPKVIGGHTNVLALEAYKQVIGQQQFGRGAVVGLLLLLPALLSFVAERRLARGRGAALSGRSVAYAPRRNPLRDGLLGLGCGAIALALLALLGTAVAASFMELWPYRLGFTLAHYDFDNLDGGGWLAFGNSLKLAALTALAGSAMVFGTAYLVEKTPAPRLAAHCIRALALLPMAVPGLVLGLGYIFCFNAPGNPLHGLYGTLAILVASTVAHFYTTAHLTATTALRQLDGEIEAVAASLRRPWWTTFRRVTLPICLPALLDIARLLFVSALTTVSCVIFLYTPDTVLASVAVLNMDDAGDTAAAAAMATLIVASALAATLLMNLAGWWGTNGCRSGKT